MTASFADLRDSDIRVRCRLCGTENDSESVTIKIDAAKSKGRKTPDWLYRKSVTMCEPCALRVVVAALNAMDGGER